MAAGSVMIKMATLGCGMHHGSGFIRVIVTSVDSGPVNSRRGKRCSSGNLSIA